ncbi:MAG TPA: hypothetical protein VE464_16030 [Streptosporangiaceae bacterium]|nr:hypothetical protein [Streptosporangiaceae bacterium]
MTEGSVSTARAANKICSCRRESAHSCCSGHPGPSTPYTSTSVMPLLLISPARPAAVWK